MSQTPRFFEATWTTILAGWPTLCLLLGEISAWSLGAQRSLALARSRGLSLGEVDEGLFIDRPEIVEAKQHLQEELLALLLPCASVCKVGGQGNRSVLIPAAATCGAPEAKRFKLTCEHVARVPAFGTDARLDQGDYNFSCGEGRQLIDNATWYRPSTGGAAKTSSWKNLRVWSSSNKHPTLCAMFGASEARVAKHAVHTPEDVGCAEH